MSKILLEKKNFFVTIILTVVIIMFLIVPIKATTNDEKVSLVTITLGDEKVEIPVVTNKNTMRSGEVGELSTFYIPVTEEGKAYNKNYVSNVKSRLTATDQFPDPKNYITFTSYINYEYNNSYILIKSAALRKNKAADSYLKGIGSPSVTIKCVGPKDETCIDTMRQVMTKESSGWGETVYTPDTWEPVLATSDMYHGLAQYRVELLYGSNFEKVICNMEHFLMK